MDDIVEPDRQRQIAARYDALYPESRRRAVSQAMALTMLEAAMLSDVLRGEGAVFRAGFFNELEREVNSV